MSLARSLLTKTFLSTGLIKVLLFLDKNISSGILRCLAREIDSLINIQAYWIPCYGLQDPHNRNKGKRLDWGKE